ncbi:MAG: histidine kinase dimerization/phospho-acceptor domain-containing protein, partial [Promethearchaeota archaeon]
MNPFALSGLLIAISSFSFGIFVFIKGHRSKANVVWSIFVFTVGIWGIGGFLVGTTKDAEIAIIWWRIAHIGIIFIPILFWHYVGIFLNIINKREMIILYSIGLAFLFFNLFTNLFINNARLVFDSFYYDSPPTFLYVIFTFFWITGIIYPHYRLLRQYYIERGIKKQQIKYFFLATAIGFTGGLTSFLPVFKIDIYPYLNFTVPLYPIIMSYAIVKYELLNIRVFGARILISVLNLIALAYIFVSKTFGEYIIKMLFFTGIVFASYLLERSFDKEIKQKQELEELAEKLRKANKKLKKFDKVKSEFISIASHQLRTPITIIKGYISMLLEGDYGKINEKANNTLKQTYKSAEHMAKLVENFLNVSRIESGKIVFDFKKEKFDIIVKETADSFNEIARTKNLKINLDIHKNLPDILVDKVKIKEVVSNLIDNAIKY